MQRNALLCNNSFRFFFSALPLLAGLLASAAPTRAPAAEAESGGVLQATLHNGLRVVIVPNKLAPVVTTEINYLVGSDEAPEGYPGTAHALEHMMFRGSPGLSAAQLAAVSASMGGRFDADTQQTVTQYYFTVPANDLDMALHIEAIRMAGLSEEEGLWDKERGAIEQEVAQDISNPEYVFYTKLLEAMFRGTPYAHDALGTLPSFQKTTGRMLRDFHKTWYTPNNAILIIAGDVDPARTLAMVKHRFGDIPARPTPARPVVRLQPVEPETIQLKTDQGFGTVALAFRLPGFHSPDYAAAQVLGDVIASQRSSLYKLVPEGKALFTDFSINPLPGSSLAYAVACFPKGGDSAALLENVRSVLSDIAEHGVPPELVEAAKQHEVADAESEKNSVAGTAEAWSMAVAVEGYRSPDDAIADIRKVTPEDVNRVARDYLDQAHAVAAVLTPESSGKPMSAQGIHRKESFASREVRPVALPKWARAARNRLVVPRSTVHPTVTVLPNGLTLIVQPESVSRTVTVYGHIRNRADLEAPGKQDGVDEVLGRLFAYGTTSLDRLAFQKALDDIAANESAGTDFALEVPAEHFDRGMALLADNELHPALPAKAFDTVRQQIAAAVAGRLRSPGYLANRSLAAALFPPHDPTLREATPETVSKLTLDDVKAYYGKVFRPDLTAIVVIGDIQPDAARAVVDKYFGDWRATGPKPDVDLPPVSANKPSVVSIPDASRVQDQVTLAETIGITRTDPDYYTLQLGNHILGGAFYATRLYRDLRERTGLVYYVSTAFDVGKTRGIFRAIYACDPPNVAKVRNIIVRNLKELQITPVGPGELRQAKGLLLTEIPLNESSVDTIAGGLIYRASHDLPLDEPTQAAHRYLKLTARDVQDAYAKWLRPDELVQVARGPKPR